VPWLLTVALTVMLASENVVRGQGRTVDVEPAREITLVRDDLYRVRDGAQYTIFLVTPDGIILGDPLTRRSARWLREELARRFPGTAVRYVILSSYHYDRAGGASVFEDTAQIVAHEAFAEEVVNARRFLADVGPLDRNGDRRLDATEVAGTPYAELLETNDADADGRVTGQEIYSGVPSLDMTYASRRTIRLGGRSVELVHPGPAQTADATVLYVPSARVVFAVDPPDVASHPFAFGTLDPRDAMAWIRHVAALDFETLLTGDGGATPRRDIVALARYLDALEDTLGEGLAGGWSLRQVLASRSLQALARAPHYDGRTSQLSAMYRRGRFVGMEVAASGLMHYAPRVAEYCRFFVACRQGGAVPAGAVGFRFATGRHLTFGFELATIRDARSSGTVSYYDEAFDFRATRGTFLAGYRVPRRDSLSLTVLGGVSATIGDVKGSYGFTFGGVPSGVRAPILDHHIRHGATAGADLVMLMGHGLSLVVPVRVTHTMAPLPTTWPNSLDVQVGAGIAISVFRRVY
jgi:glyoxylase-like metal-dependent hydrolase (beta-lactamase superfamily II)